MESGRLTNEDLLFRHPFNMIVGGASGSGKTHWVCRFLRDYQQLITPRIEHVLYCYGIYNSRVLELERDGIETHFGLPREETIKERQKPLLLVLDDLMIEAKSPFLDLLFTRGSHHWGVSVVFITQNMFAPSLKTARNNSHYIVLLRNPSGQLQIRNLGVQLFPGRLEYFLDAYRKSTSKNFGYLVVDMHPSSPEMTRLRTSIFSDEAHFIYTPKS
jgi:hypothetical protein